MTQPTRKGGARTKVCVIAHSNAVATNLLRTLAVHLPRCTRVNTFVTTEQARERMEKDTEVVIIDFRLGLSNMTGVAGLKLWIRQSFPNALVIGTGRGGGVAEHFKAAGADGFYDQNDGYEKLLELINTLP